MRKSEILDPVVRAVVLMRESEHILSDYVHSVSSADDKTALADVTGRLRIITDMLETDFGVYL
jgi:hypothetical protein